MQDRAIYGLKLQELSLLMQIFEKIKNICLCLESIYSVSKYIINSKSLENVFNEMTMTYFLKI